MRGAALLALLPLVSFQDPDQPPVVRFGDPAPGCRVPGAFEQGLPLPPQSVSALDVSEDGRVAVATLGFRHDRNVWTLSNDGRVSGGRYVLPWAPFQVAALRDAKAVAVGLAYSRITPPHPTISLIAGEGEETALVDRQGESGWLRYGSGDWRTGWAASAIGDLVVRAGRSVVTVPADGGARRLLEDGKVEACALPARPFRMAASADGSTLAAGFIAADARALLSVRDAATLGERWSARPSVEAASIPALPDPAADFPELADRFHMKPDEVVPFRVAASVSLSRDGARAALFEVGGRMWVRRGPVIGRWDPPYRRIPFVPRQRGWLRVLKSAGEEVARARLPREGLFEAHLGPAGDVAWCAPMSWFARGMAGAPWLPCDPGARMVFVFDVARRSWSAGWEFPDAVSDLAVHPGGERVLVSCWDGGLYLVSREGRLEAKVHAGGPARLRWSPDGAFAVAGMPAGEIVSIDARGLVRWRTALPAAELPPLKEPLKPAIEGVPVWQVGRTGPEHAYVGDMWLVKAPEGALLVDAGGTSSLPHTLERIKSAAVDPKEVKFVLHSHSHGDHAGGAYLWRARGAKIVAPESAAFTLGWVIPTQSDYGVWPPRPVDVPLALKRPGDEAELTLAGLKVRAIFVPGHSVDSVLYLAELGGRRVVFTGDIGFQGESDVVHRCWGDVEKAKAVVEVIRARVLPWKPDHVFRGHGAVAEGMAFLEDLVQRSMVSIEKAGK